MFWRCDNANNWTMIGAQETQVMTADKKSDIKPAGFRQSFTLSTDVLANSAHEPLKKIVDPYSGLRHIPPELGDHSPGCFVFIELNKCFSRAGYVAEGMLANVIWGFEQCGYDPNRVAAGLTDLRKKGYITYSDSGGLPIQETDFDPQKIVWIRYTKKMLDLFVRKLVL